MHIGLTRLLEDGVVTTYYDLNGRLCGGFQDLDWGDDKKIEEAMANTKNNENKVKNL